jgi:cytoskeletal protein CcmA (bactofilin family)
MRERWGRRRTPQLRAAVAKPIPAPSSEPGLIGWREIRTFLDPGTEVTGKLNFSTPTRIEGRLRGEVRASDLLVVAAGGVVQGTIRAGVLIVAGEVRGQILGATRVEIQPGGRVTGQIETKALVAPEGALLDCDCRMGVDSERAAVDVPTG